MEKSKFARKKLSLQGIFVVFIVYVFFNFIFVSVVVDQPSTPNSLQQNLQSTWVLSRALQDVPEVNEKPTTSSAANLNVKKTASQENDNSTVIPETVIPGTNISMKQILKDMEVPFRWKRLGKIAKRNSEKYQNADPFPHIVFDGLIPSSITNAIEMEFPETQIGKDGCYKGSNFCFKRNDNTDYLKSHVGKEERMGIVTKLFFGLLRSSTFVTFLSQLTGIGGLIPDPHYIGSGLHMTTKGGFINLHADFNWHDQLKLDRRVNCFLYLNPNWEESWNGHLEFWNRNATKCGARILPKMGRFACFSTTDFSYHGHPQPLNPPEGRARRSLAMYYYTAGRPSHECLNNTCAFASHGTLFKERTCNQCIEKTCKAFDENIETRPLPPKTRPRKKKS